MKKTDSGNTSDLIESPEKEKLKIGVMTFWDSQENYGQLLQACALQVFLKKKGYDPFLIRYDKSKSVKRKKPSFFKKLVQTNWLKLLNSQAVRKKLRSISQATVTPSRHFDAFRNGYLKMSSRVYASPSDLKDAPPEADVYITGSDQVWNFEFTGDCDPFFLQFGNRATKRVAYAASFGHRHLPENIKNRYTEYLATFDAISVRESSGVALCHQMGFVSTQLLPDPTLLLNKNTWSKLSKSTPEFSSAKGRKVIIYTLGNRFSESRDEVINYVATLPETVVTHVSINKDFSGTAYPTIPEWLGYFRDADLVITNSFHGMVFSILFNKNFIGLPSSGAKAGMNERLTTLLEEFGLEHRLLHTFDVKKVNKLMKDDTDWSLINSKIKNWIRQADRFLDFDRFFSRSYHQLKHRENGQTV